MERISNGYSTELIIPEAKLYRLTSTSKKDWWKEAAIWNGRLTVIDALTHFLLEFHADGATFARTRIHEHPTHVICTLATSHKRFTILLDTDEGHNIMYGLAFTDKSDANDLQAVLRSVDELKHRHGHKMDKARSVSRPRSSLSSDDNQASGFYANYTRSVAQLSKTLEKYDTIFQNFVNAYNKDLDALMTNNPGCRDVFKKADIFRQNEKEKGKEKIKEKEKDKQTDATSSGATNKKKRTANLAELSMHHDDENDEEHGEHDHEAEVAKPSKLKKKASKKAKKIKKVKSEKSDEFKEPAPKAENTIQPLQPIAETPSTSKEAPATVHKSTKIHNIQEMLTKTPRVALTPLKNVSRFLESASKEPNESSDASLGPITRGKVKQMASCMEQKIKALKTSCYSANTSQIAATVPQPSTNASNIPMSSKIARINAQKFRSSIDKRKLRSSQAKAEIKRKSVKQVQAFIKGITNMAAKNANTTITQQQPELICLDATVDQGKSSEVGEDVTLSEDKAMKSSVAKEILSNTMVQNQYRVATQIGKSVMASSKLPERKKSFIKFLERNTPSKLTRTELEEKRKIELLYKEKKEMERLEERDKAKQEKIDNAKKKREEKMKKIIEQKAKRLEDDQKRRDEIEAKQREMEENKKRLAEEKKKEEQRLREIKIAEEKRRLEEQQLHQQQQQQVQKMPPMPGSAIKPKLTHDTTKYGYTASAMSSGYESLIHASNASKLTYASSNGSDKSAIFSSKNIPVAKPLHAGATSGLAKPLETTYILNTPGKPAMNKPPFGKANNLAHHVLSNNQHHSQMVNQSYPVTPLQEPVYRLKNADNYDVSDLKSDDETDDEEEPSKPIPPWAKDSALMNKAREQCMRKINYTKIFKTASTYEIKLDEIFRTRRKKFTERSSSANWTTPPIWHTGLNGEESFRLLYK